MIVLLVALSLAADHHVVRAGETVASLADQLGVSEAVVRGAAGLDPTGEPVPGTLLTLPEPPGAAPDVGALCAASGPGRIRTPVGAPPPFEAGVELPAGSEVCTQDGGFATVCLARGDDYEHDNVTLYPNTCVRVEGAFRSPTRRSSLVTVESGNVAVRPKPSSAASDLAVRTEASTTVGADGGFRIAVDGRSTRTEAVDGAVAVIAQGREQRLEPGQGVAVEVGAAPGPPHPLQLPGALLAPDDAARLWRPAFTWKPADRALGYQVELAATPDFVELVSVERVGAPSWAPERLFLPFRVPGLWWRVATVDRMGFVGVPTPARRLEFPSGVGP